MDATADARVKIRDGGMSATVVLPGVTVKDIHKTDFATVFIPTLAQHGKDILDSDKRFLNPMIEDIEAGLSNFIIYSAYDVTPFYYTWVGSLKARASLRDELDASKIMKTRPLRFEHDVIDVGNTSHIWHTLCFDGDSGRLLIKYSFKYVRMDLSTRRPIPVPEYAKRLARAHDGASKSMQYTKISIPKDVSFISDYTKFFTKRWKIMERNIDQNKHTNYLVYVRFIAKTLSEGLPSLLGNHPFYVSHLSVLYEGESVLGDEIDVHVCCKHDSLGGAKMAGKERDVVVKVERLGKRITLCRYQISTELEDGRFTANL